METAIGAWENIIEHDDTHIGIDEVKDGKIPQSIHQGYVDSLRWDRVGLHTGKNARELSVITKMAIEILLDTGKS